MKVSRSILIADAESAIRSLFSRLVSPHQVIEAENADQVRSLVQEHIPDLFILECELTDTPGTLLAAELRADPRFKETPIFILSMELAPSTRSDKPAWTGWIKKPFSVIPLRNEILKALSRQTKLSKRPR